MRAILTAAYVVLPLCAIGQNCEIKTEDEHGKPIEFVVTIADTSFTSDDKGVLLINKKYYTKYKAKDVEFKYRHNLAIELYRAPMFIRKNRRLQDLCGQTLIAVERE